MRGLKLTTRTGYVILLLDMVTPHLFLHGNFSMRYVYYVTQLKVVVEMMYKPGCWWVLVNLVRSQ